MRQRAARRRTRKSRRCEKSCSRACAPARSAYTFESLDTWNKAMRLKGDAYTRKLADPAFRAALREEIARPGHFRLFNGEWDKVHVVESARPHAENRSIAELAGEAAKDPL